MNTITVDTTRLRIRQAVVCAVCLLGGLGVLVYAGPGREFVRGLLGDVLVVPFLYFGLGVLWPHARRARAVGVAVLAVTVETLQLFELAGPDAAWWLRLALGTTFDPADLVAYAVGLGVALSLDVCGVGA